MPSRGANSHGCVVCHITEIDGGKKYDHKSFFLVDLRANRRSLMRNTHKHMGGIAVIDWDRLRVFYVAAEAGSFTHAGDQLALSQSAVSRQVSALERDLKVPLFHRHARGLILTEQGELLFRTAKEMTQKLEATRARLHDSREQPNGELKVTTAVGLGTHWLVPRLGRIFAVLSGYSRGSHSDQ